MQPDDKVLVFPKEAILTQSHAALTIRSFSSPSRNCCGFLFKDRSLDTTIIPYENVISCALDSTNTLIIRYAKEVSKTRYQLTTLGFNKRWNLENTVVEDWAKELEERAWNHGKITRNKRIKILVNPAGGTGNAQKLWLRDIEPVLLAAGCSIDVEFTQHQGHATEIARDLNVADYDVIACCSGDGTPHEVFNGLGQREDARLALGKIAVVQLPCGSGNAMSWNCFGTAIPTLAAVRLVKSVRMPLDLLSVTQYNPELGRDTRTLSFLSQAVGIIADIDLGTDNLRWVGAKRFELGFFIRIMAKTIYPCDIAVAVQCETKEQIRQHHKAEMEKDDAPEADRLKAVLKEYQMWDEDREHAADAGLPPLQYGTVSDNLPAGWIETPYDNLGNFYSGNMTAMSADMPFFPAALPSDGVSDLVMIRGDIGRKVNIEMATSVPEYKFFDKPDVNYRKVTGYRITPRAASGYISIDGESIRHAKFQAEVHRSLGTTMSVTGKKYEVKDFE